MGMTRRQTIAGGTLALLGTGFLGRVEKVSAMQVASTLTEAPLIVRIVSGTLVLSITYSRNLS